jgi:general secretion pathway protein K
VRPSRLSERGVALALVLWLLVVLGAVAAAVVGSTRRESQMLINARARTVARYAAESGIAAGAALLQRRLMTANGPAHQVLAFTEVNREFAELHDVALGNAQFSVALTNLSGRLDLNQAQTGALLGLFSQFTSRDDAEAIVAALEDWRDPDDLVRSDGAEQEVYARAGSPYLPRNAPLNRLDELRRVRGVSGSLAHAVEPYITVTGDLLIDINGATEVVLAAIPGIGRDGARAIQGRRRASGPFTSIAEVQAFLGKRHGGTTSAVPLTGIAVAPTRLLLVSRGWMVGHPLTHEIQAAYAVVGNQLRLQSWRERDL